MKEKILEAFRELGFKLEEEEGMGYCFKYEGLNLLYMYNENDEEFLNIALPGIVEVEDDKMLQICALLEKINSTLKYIKAYMLGNSVWLFYERELIEQREQSRTCSDYAESREKKTESQLIEQREQSRTCSDYAESQEKKTEGQLIEQREQSRTCSDYAESREKKTEGQFCGEEDLMTVISRMILHLEAGLVFARKAMAEIEETMTNGSSDDDTTESAEEIVTEEIADDDNNE